MVLVADGQRFLLPSLVLYEWLRGPRIEEELNALPIEDDDVDAIVGSHALNLYSWIEDEVILSLPLVPRHEQCSPPLQREAGPGSSSRPNPFAELAAALKRGGSSEIH